VSESLSYPRTRYPQEHLHEKSEHNVKGCPCEQEKHSTHHRHATVLTTGVKLGQLGDHEYSLEPEEDEGWG